MMMTLEEVKKAGRGQKPTDAIPVDHSLIVQAGAIQKAMVSCRRNAAG